MCIKQIIVRFLLILVIAASQIACSDNEHDKTSANRNAVPQESTVDESANTRALAVDKHFLAEPDANGWPTYGGQPSGTQYSALDQVNLSNVDQLEVAWTYHTGEISTGSDEVDATVYQVTPILANDKLYLCTPFNHIVALDPGTGEELWRFDPKKPLTGTMHKSHVCRGVSHWAAESEEEREQFCGKRVFETTTHGTLVAVDANTGRACTDFGENGRIELNNLDYKGDGRIASTSPPAIYKNAVIVGGSVIDNKWKDSLDGIVRGFDARTGEERWNWNPIPEHLSDQVGGANTWAPMSIDQERGPEPTQHHPK